MKTEVNVIKYDFSSSCSPDIHLILGDIKSFAKFRSTLRKASALKGFVENFVSVHQEADIEVNAL